MTNLGYAFLVDVDRADNLNLLAEYVDACRAHRKQKGA